MSEEESPVKQPSLDPEEESPNKLKEESPVKGSEELKLGPK